MSLARCIVRVLPPLLKALGVLRHRCFDVGRVGLDVLEVAPKESLYVHRVRLSLCGEDAHENASKLGWRETAVEDMSCRSIAIGLQAVCNGESVLAW